MEKNPLEEHVPLSDFDLVDEGPAAATTESTQPAPVQKPAAGKHHGMSMPMQLPHDEAVTEQHTTTHIVEQFMQWREAFLRSAQENMHKLGLAGARVVDFRSLKHWDRSLVPDEAEKPKRMREDDAKWKRAMADYFQRHPDAQDITESADEDDFILLVEYPSSSGQVDDKGTKPQVMWVRRTHPETLRS